MDDEHNYIQEENTVQEEKKVQQKRELYFCSTTRDFSYVTFLIQLWLNDSVNDGQKALDNWFKGISFFSFP